MSAVLALTSCNDFLDKYPKYGVDPESEVTNEIAVALTTACYKTLQSSNMYNQRIWSLDIIAGNSEVGAGGGTDGLETVQASNFIAQSDNGFALYVWRSPWVGIGRCNIVLSNLPSASVSNEIKTRCMGEAYFLRGFNYLKLVSQYGGVPLKLTPSETPEREFSRATAEETLQQVIDDLKDAYTYLPETASMTGKMTKDAAAHFLAKAYLLRASEINDDWNGATKEEDLKEALRLAREVISHHNLAPNYADLWNYTEPNGANEQLDEIILAAQFSSNTVRLQETFGTHPRGAYLTGFALFRTSCTYIEAPQRKPDSFGLSVSVIVSTEQPVSYLVLFLLRPFAYDVHAPGIRSTEMIHGLLRLFGNNLIVYICLW